MRREWLSSLGVACVLLAGCTADDDGSLLGSAEQALSFTPNLPWPSGVTFYVSQGQNGSYSHSGNLAYALDFSGAGCGGTHVLAVGDGSVTYAFDDCADYSPDCNYGWGNAVVLDHGNGDFSKYTHLRFGSIPGLGVGDDVCRGDHLGDLGTSGNSTGDHLHLQFQSGGLLNSPSVQFEGFAETSGVPAEDEDVTSENVEGAGCGAQPTCEVPIDLGTTIIDDQTNCFHRGGTPSYWWEESFGHDGHHWFTYTTSDSSADCTATWDADVLTAADYLVEIFVPDNPDALTEQVRYEVRHGGTTETLTVDQAAHRGQWVALGTFGFAAGGDQHVRVFDNTGEPYVNADGPRLLCDAVRYTSTGSGTGGSGAGGSGGGTGGQGASAAGGFGGAGASVGAGGAELPTGGSGGLGVGLPPSDEEADCSCHVPRARGSAAGAWAALVLAAAAARRRVRRRRCSFPALAAAWLGAVLLPAAANAQPAFPGAEGFGAMVTGGRGGQVIKVTSLAEEGAGTLREALLTEGPRIIVFDVSGVIDLGEPNVSDPFDESPTNNILVIGSGDVTIAGQTAPGGGITIRGRLYAAYDASVQNIIIRHVRIRPPAVGGGDGEQYDVLRLSPNSRVIVDHVSVSFGVDESVDLYETTDVTFQWCEVSEGATEGHPEGSHNYGLLGAAGRISIHHTLFAHNSNRNPALSVGPAESINNLAYNVRHGFIHHNAAEGQFNIVGNWFGQGPDDSLHPFYFDGEPFTNVGYHLVDNTVFDPGELEAVVDNPWQLPDYFQNLGAPESLYSSTPFDFGSSGHVPVTTQASGEAYDSVLATAGAFPRDIVTRLIVGEIEERTGSWGAHYPADLFEGLSATTPPVDTDCDGMPDEWESAHALDPNDPNDSTDVLGSGYTAIEEYINELADALVGASGGAGGSGGTGQGGTGQGGAGTGATGTGAGAAPAAPGASPESDDGCGCRVPVSTGSRAAGPWGVLLGLSAGVLVRRRRRGPRVRAMAGTRRGMPRPLLPGAPRRHRWRSEGHNP